ncbi:MAG: right-handed parallel beta-helix repeat-containing protein [Gammaproteobacteria bacterium]
MSNVGFYHLPLVVGIFACIEEGREHLFAEGSYGEQRVSDQGLPAGHRGSFWLSFIDLLINTSREKLPTFIVLSLLVFPPLVNAETYYVAPNGSNSNTGTQAQPFATLQRAHDIAVAGDTIYMRGGAYKISSQQTLTRGGTSGNLIKVFAYPGEVPILDAASIIAIDAWVIRMNGASWWRIKGLEIKNNPKGGGIAITSGSHNNIIENNNVHHNGALSAWAATGISVFENAANNLILNNDSHHNRDMDNGDADGIGVSSNGTGNVLRGNRVWRNSDDGIDMWDGSPTLIDGNWAWENGYDDNLQLLGNGAGFKLGGQHAGKTSGGHTVKNNLAWKNRLSGFDDNDAQHPLILYNNTAWDNTSGNYRFRTQSNTLRNNISFGSLGSVSGSDTFNSWTLGVTVSAADFSSVDDTIARGPRNADGSLPASNFLRLVAGSDLIDRGVNIGTAYIGIAPDLGAYEYGGSVTASAPLPPPPPAPSSSCTQTPLTLSSAFSDGGFSYMVMATFGTAPDNLDNRTQSTLLLFENGVEIGPAHSRHSDVRDLGVGRFSHWSHTNGTGEALRLSASNNSDPRTNGMSYTYCVPVP